MQSPQDIAIANRRLLVVLVHLALWAGAFFGAFLLRFDFLIPEHYLQLRYVAWLLPLVVVRTVAFAHLGLFQGLWRYTGAHDLENLVKATALSTALLALGVLFTSRGFPRSVIIMEFLLALTSVGGLRFAVRAMARWADETSERGEQKRLLIVGAGDSGEALLRELGRNLSHRYAPVAFVDDNANKQNLQIHGVPVQGTIDDIPGLVARRRIDDVIVAIPSATGAQMRRIVDLCAVSKVPVRTLPGVEGLIDGRVTVNQLRQVEIDDLLGRDPVNLDSKRISKMTRARTVMVTGAGGSIGSELCRQVARFQPRTLVLVEQAENALFYIHRELRQAFPDLPIEPCVADVTDAVRIDQLFAEHKPELVIHAAAHKHVPMMEWNPGEAVKNNVGGTRVLTDASHRHNVERFVMVSTDKAVNPTSVMGCSKRIAELIVQSWSQRSETVFVTVRFGNVLGSAGSVIPLFKEQIKRGGPVTVTHKDMLRYFMTIPEASQLVLQAVSMGHTGEVYILDMGEPVTILKLAEDLIRLSGLEPHTDVEIVFTGMRPGEKLLLGAVRHETPLPGHRQRERAEDDASEDLRREHPAAGVRRGEPGCGEAAGRRRRTAGCGHSRADGGPGPRVQPRWAEVDPAQSDPAHAQKRRLGRSLRTLGSGCGWTSACTSPSWWGCLSGSTSSSCWRSTSSATWGRSSLCTR